MAPRYTLNETIFDNITNEYEAYALGYLFAKGSIYKGINNDRYELTISGTEKELLYKIREVLNSTHPIKQKGNGYVIRISNRTLVDKLEELGLTTYKSDTLIYPEYIPEELERHFIRGYFDGKGSFIIERNRRITSNISAGSYRFIEGLRDKLVLYGLNRAEIHQYGNRNATNVIRYYVNDTRKLFNLLYFEARIYSSEQVQRYRRGV